MRIREINWPLLAILVVIILFWGWVFFIFFRSEFFQELLLWMARVSTGRI